MSKAKFVKVFPQNYFQADDQIDFHDFGQLNPFEIENTLNIFLEDNQIKGNKYLLVITGKGQVVKPIVFKILRDHKFVKRYKVAGYFTGQGGAFEVELN